MTFKTSQVYKCEDSDLTIEVVASQAKCECIECCGKPMKLMEEKTSDAGKEKHVPVVHDGKLGIKVMVGSIPHPMEPDHYIEFIEVLNGPYVNRYYLKPGQAPEAEFYVPNQPGLIVRAYCNKHGLWRA